jgi:hypothetical protein
VAAFHGILERKRHHWADVHNPTGGYKLGVGESNGERSPSVLPARPKIDANWSQNSGVASSRSSHFEDDLESAVNRFKTWSAIDQKHRALGLCRNFGRVGSLNL